MPEYVPQFMETCFYEPLKDIGWVATGTHQGDEWDSYDGQFEIRFRHSMSILSVDYRRKLHRQGNEPTETYLDRKTAAGWNTISRAYGQTVTPMMEWATQTLATIWTWADSMRSVATAPGEL